MASDVRPGSQPLGPAVAGFLRTARFKPALLDALRGYTGRQFQNDVVAGLVVGVVALPLAIAFAIASGAEPSYGLITAALAGALVAVLGGSRVQIAGPTGAFVVILAKVTAEHGFPKLLVATFLAGILLFLFGFLRLGTLIKFIPYPVTTGFTAGIAVIIFFGQGFNILGLGGRPPRETLHIVEAISQRVPDINAHAVLLTLATIFIIVGAKRYVPRIPGPALALIALTFFVAFVPLLNVPIVDDLYDIPQGLPTVAFPALTLSVVQEMLPSAVTIALLGAIESLLSAVVADGMIGTKHDSNQELMGQGLANLIIPFFGGFAATGAIARTATNVQNGGRTPVAAIVHGAVVFLVLIAAGPLAAKIPMAVLAGILAVVAWNMSERHRFAQLLRMPAADALVLLTTFGLTILVDLTVAVIVGIGLAAALFIGRMSRLSQISLTDPESESVRKQHDLEGKDVPPGVMVYSIDGPFFFGAADSFQETMANIGRKAKVVIFRMRRVPYLDATGLNALSTVHKHLSRQGSVLIISAPQTQPLEMMMRGGLLKQLGDQNIRPNIDESLKRARELLGLPVPASPA